jgi:hypothetical protein
MFWKGLVISVIHVCLVAALGLKLLYDRHVLPRVWIKAAPYDPNLPIRGRYVSLQAMVEHRGIPNTATDQENYRIYPCVLHVENGRLFADVKQEGNRYDTSDLHLVNRKIGGENVFVLNERMAFFIPEHVPDPSRRLQGEQLWVETTIPKKGIPRPIRLGVSTNNGSIMPLDLQ